MTDKDEAFEQWANAQDFDTDEWNAAKRGWDAHEESVKEVIGAVKKMRRIGAQPLPLGEYPGPGSDWIAACHQVQRAYDRMKENH